jgi:anti-sigma factor RsiW
MERHRRPPRRQWRQTAAVAGLLALGISAGWLGHASAPNQIIGMAALAQEATDSFRVFGPDHMHPVEFLTSRRADLETWLAQRLKRTILQPDLAASGYRFMGGRLVATSNGPAAMFMYDDDHGTRLVMLSRPVEKVGDSTSMSQHQDGSVICFSWAQDGMGYSLVGATAAQTLHPLADEIRRQIASPA